MFDFNLRCFDLQAAMSIIESYILLGGADFLRLHASGVVKIFDIVVGNVKERGMLCTLPVIDSLIQVLYSLTSLSICHVHLWEDRCMFLMLTYKRAF